MKMKSFMVVVVLAVVAVVLAAAERRHHGAGSPSVEESNYQLFRHMRPDTRIVNQPGGQSARDDYRFSKLQDRLRAKAGVNQIRRRRAASTRQVLDDEDEN